MSLLRITAKRLNKSYRIGLDVYYIKLRKFQELKLLILEIKESWVSKEQEKF